MYNSLPQVFTGTTLTFNNPGTKGVNAGSPVNVQVRNASGWVITVATYTGNQMIDPFTAATVPIDVGQQSIQIVGALNAYTGLSGYISLEWLLPNETPSEPDGPLTSAATIASISGAITTQQAQALFAGSPYSFTNAFSLGLPWPSGGPWSSAKLVVAPASKPCLITVTGISTGAVYLSETVSRGSWDLNISSLIEPLGVSVTGILPTNWTAAWNFGLSLVASVNSQNVRDVYGPGDAGPILSAQSIAVAGTGGGTSYAALAGGGKGNSFRVYSMWLSMASSGTILGSSSYIAVPGVFVLLSCQVPGGASASSSATNGATLSIPGGFLCDSNTIGLNAISLGIDNGAGGGQIVARGGIFYSEES